MRKLVIDRYEGIYAICEDADRKMFAIETAELPKDAKPGCVIVINDDGAIEVDAEETDKRKQKARMLEDKLFN